MTDQELLKLAAKAAEYELADTLDGYPLWVEGQGIWNPLTDDADAFRLAVDCMIAVDFSMGNCGQEVWATSGKVDDTFVELLDNYSDARRAIVRAAAEIGKAIGEQQ